jgi:hypothetical protein
MNNILKQPAVRLSDWSPNRFAYRLSVGRNIPEGPRRNFEHLHLVSFPYEAPSQALPGGSLVETSSRKLWRL